MGTVIGFEGRKVQPRTLKYCHFQANGESVYFVKTKADFVIGYFFWITASIKRDVLLVMSKLQNNLAARDSKSKCFQGYTLTFSFINMLPLIWLWFLFRIQGRSFSKLEAKKGTG